MSLACCSSEVDVGCIPLYKPGVAHVMYHIFSFIEFMAKEIKMATLSLVRMNTKRVRRKDSALSLDYTVWYVNARKMRDIFSQKALFKQWHVISICLIACRSVKFGLFTVYAVALRYYCKQDHSEWLVVAPVYEIFCAVKCLILGVRKERVFKRSL